MPPINSYRDNPLYPDRYVDGSNWVRVLPIPGRALQTSEITEVQSIFQGQMKMALSAMYREGSAISGLRVIGTGPTYTITNGHFYVQGMTVPVEGVLAFTPSITQTVYVMVSETILTEVTTPSLRDPIRGTGYGLEGAHRLVWSGVITNMPGPSSYPIASISSDGQVVQRPLGGGNDRCLDMLAAYTKDRMGDFLLEGMLVTYGGVRQSTSTPLSTYKKGEVDRLSSELLEYNALLTTSGTELSKVRLELEVAVGIATQSPSAPNRFIVDTKRKRVQELEAIMGSLSAETITITAQLSSMSSTLPLRELLNISPGVVYISGYRIDKATPTTIEVPRSNAIEEVEAAKFTYISAPASSVRTLLPSGLYTDGGSTSLVFTGIPYLAGYITITATYQWTTSNRPLYDLVEAFQKGVCTYTSNVSLAPSTLKEALLRVVSISMTGVSTLLIASQYRDSLIGLTITSNRYEVDVESAYLTSPSPALTSYELGRKPVADIVRVVADLEATLLPITRGTNRDELGDDTIFIIKEVVQGLVRYVEGRDYTLYGQGWIEWKPGVGPVLGSTYYVTYIYTQPLNKGIDYRLLGDRVELINSTRRPAPGYTFTVDYTYSLPQMGRVFIDRDGVIGYSLSPPSIEPVPPQASIGTLTLATFTLIRGGVVVHNQAVRRLSVADISALLREYRNRALLSTLPVANVSVDSNVSITPSYITTPTRYMNVPIKYMGGGHLHRGHHVTLPYSAQPYLEQGRVTSIHTLKPYSTPQIYLHPQVISATAVTATGIQPCSDIPGQAPWTNAMMPATPTVTTFVLVVSVGLDDAQTYAILYAGKNVSYTVKVGFNTASGIRPVKGRVELYISLVGAIPGSYRVELKPIGITSLSAATSLTILHPLYRQLGIDSSSLPSALYTSSVAAPLSQTIIVPEDIHLSSIGLYLRYIDSGATVWVTVDTIDTTLTLRKVIAKGTLVSPTTSSKGEEVTRVQLEYPVYLESGRRYQISLHVHGGEVDIYTATLGKKDVRDGSYVGGQLLYLGEVSISGDGVNIIPLPQEDLSHTLYIAKYLMNPLVIALGTYGLPDLLTPLTAFCVNGVDVLPPGTSILYEYKSDSTWKPFNRGSIKCINPTSSIILRATMYTSRATLTPSLTLEGVTVSLYSNAESGTLRGESAATQHTGGRLSFKKRGSQGTATPSTSITEAVWVPMTLVSAVPVGDDIRYTYSSSHSTSYSSEWSIALWDRPSIREVMYDIL